MSVVAKPTWADVLIEHAAERNTARRVISQLAA